MTHSITSMPLSRSMDIPFNKLVLSQANVRQVNAGVSIEDLSQDIGRRGLLTSINVRPVMDVNGAETGKYEIPAGGRRFRALELLVKAKRMAKTALVPCVIGDASAGTSAEDDSMAENTHRVALHPLDQYRAFLTLRRQNMTEEDIAARYFVSVNVVKQRLRLAAVSPALLDLYAKDELTLDQLMAFSISGDHIRQEQVWESVAALQGWARGAQSIRHLLTETSVGASDRRAVFVGLEAYEAAGGEVSRDLFHADNGGWLQDVGLLDRLVDEKLAALGETVAAEGWKWVEVMPSLPFDHFHGLRMVDPAGSPLSAEDQATLQALRDEHQAIEEEFDGWEELPDDVDQRLGEIETAIESLEGANEPVFDPADIARGGAVVTIDRHGSAQIHRGYVRPEDEESVDGEGEAGSEDGSEPSVRQTAIIALGGSEPPVSAGEDDDSGVLRPLPEKLVMELTAFRTVALRDAVAGNPHIAMTLLLHKLVGGLFHHSGGGSCLQAFVSHPNLVGVAPKDLNDSIPARSMDDRKERWGDVIPADDDARWDWINQADDFTRGELLAFCVSFGINALFERSNPYGGGPSQRDIERRLAQADRVAKATGLDLVADGWRPTGESYLNRVPKPRIIEAVREGCGERPAQLIEHLKKGDMVIEAERLLSDTGWLPEILRGSEQVEEANPPEAESLPSFLSDDDQDDAAAPIAAE
jgi:ParB family chromosome partitioning protein